MRQVLNKSIIVMAAASGLLAAVGGTAHADASAEGAAVGSPGVGSGNAVQAPVHIPVNVCGNTVNVIALLNPAFGNKCVNADGPKHNHPPVQPPSTNLPWTNRRSTSPRGRTAGG